MFPLLVGDRHLVAGQRLALVLSHRCLAQLPVPLENLRLASPHLARQGLAHPQLHLHLDNLHRRRLHLDNLHRLRQRSGSHNNQYLRSRNHNSRRLLSGSHSSQLLRSGSLFRRHQRSGSSQLLRLGNPLHSVQLLSPRRLSDNHHLLNPDLVHLALQHLPQAHLGHHLGAPAPALALEPVAGFLPLHLSHPGFRQHQRNRRHLDSHHLEPLPLGPHKVHLLHLHRFKVPLAPRRPHKVLLALRHLHQAQSAGPPQYPSPPSEQHQQLLRSVAQALGLRHLAFLRLRLLLLSQLQWQQPQPMSQNRLHQHLCFHGLKFR
jgi:hypothetical protein